MNNMISQSENQALSDFDNLFTNYLRPLRLARENGSSSQIPAIDVIEHDKSYELRAELPGVKKEDLDVVIKDGVLTINAQTKTESTTKEAGRVVCQERHLGKYVRSLRLGRDIDESKVEADYADGVLTLVIAKLKEVQPKKIKVKF